MRSLASRCHVFLRLCVYLTPLIVLTWIEIPKARAQEVQATAKRLLGYYPSWSKYNNPPYAYSAAQIPYNQLTHIAHAFLLLDEKADGTIDVPSGFVEPALLSKAHAAGVKVLVSIGGGGGIQGPRFNEMASEEAHRQAFVKNVHAFLTEYGYDGVDIDWEVPNAENTSECTTLMQELRDELPSGQWLISMAVTSDPQTYGRGLDIRALAPLVDFMNVMTYDFTGSRPGYAGLNSPLYQDPADPIQSGSVKTSMDLYAQRYAVPIAQLNIGTPFYGYVFDGVDALWAACGTVCTATQQNYGPFIKPLLTSSEWKKEFDKSAASPYMVNTSSVEFISYDGTSSTSAKTTYIMKQRGFGGVFVWELSADYDGKSQDLMNALYKAWVTAK
jgi:chitinase